MKLLLAIDDSKFAEAAIQAVISQVRQDHTQVLVLHALDWSDFMPTPFPVVGAQPMFSVPRLESIIEVQTQRAHDLVKIAAERLRSAGFEASTSVVEGDPKMVILDCATEWRADLIVVGSHGRKGVTRFLLGSVSEAVARHAHCSVEIARLPANS
jgi:nucleotide-binding universal stress UspA family protein